MNKKEETVIRALLTKEPGCMTYPADLEKLSRKSISRAGAKLVCDHLTKSGLLEMKKKPSPNHSRSTPHYMIRTDRRSLFRLVQEYSQTLMGDDPCSWQRGAEFTLMGSKFVRTLVTPDFVRDVLASKKICITQPEQQDTKKIPSFVVYPVRPPHRDVSEMIPEARMYSADSASHKPDESITRQYYEKVEERKIILPILSLILISPTALGYFLSGWKPYDPEYGSASRDIIQIEHMVFRLVWNAINDIAVTRNIPANDFVMDAYVSSESLLEIGLRSGDSIRYDARFDTNRLYYGDGGGIYEIETNPENCEITITWEAARRTRRQQAR